MQPPRDPAGELPLFWRADPAGGWTWSCHGWSAFTGLTEIGSRGRGWLAAVHPADRAAAAEPWVLGASGGGRRPFRLKSGADYREVRPYAAHALRPDGTLGGWIGTLMPQAGLAGARLLCAAEVQLHIRNAFAAIRSLAARTARSSETVDQCGTHFEGRLAAFGRLQEALFRSPDGGVDLEGLIREEMVAHGVADARLSIAGPPLRLKGRAAEAFALVVHELTINAIKFGALTAPRGAIAVGWTVDHRAAPARLLFCWSETGVRVAGPAPRRRGFGTEAIERVLPEELDAATRLDFVPGGLRCSIALPLGAERVASAPGPGPGAAAPDMG